MLSAIYITIIIYFFLGALGFYAINRKKSKEEALRNWTKYISYFVIINGVFFSITLNQLYFRYLTIIIILIAAYELFNLFIKSEYKSPYFFGGSAIVLIIVSISFYRFSYLEKGTILFTFLVLSIFDSFSQITGQLFGRKKIIPTISPNKTLGGLIGGTAIALIGSILLNKVYSKPVLDCVLMAIGIISSAFIGDIAASYYKRKYKVKDFSNLIPGHGGVLDRFDSLIAGGAFVHLIYSLIYF
ncbi:MAG: phosphatidate cytidylyltransferase [Bacteroidales bacterium]|nr:hypothetical protein CYCD_16410 [Tenuifilaceae bacterium CYCD]